MHKPAILIGLVLIVWEVVVSALDIAPYLLPKPTEIFGSMITDAETLAANAVPTLLHIWLGFILAVLSGTGIAILISYSRIARESLFPILVSFQVVPKVALAPLFLVWLGFGMAPKVIVAALIAFFPIVINTSQGLRSVEQELVQWMRSLGASPYRIFTKLSLPWAMPYFFASLRIAIGLSVVGAIVGEFIGADQGLGYLIVRAGTNFQTTMLFGSLITVSLLGVASYGVIALLDRLLVPWQQDVNGPAKTM